MSDEDYMRLALELSLQGRPSPNPYVGAVLVKDGKIISRGYHQKAGMAHAEAEAIGGQDCKGATLYVTLEPCSHWGKTPPCTKAIIEAAVKEVVYGAEDPTEKVRGREELEAAGVTVRGGVLARECELVNEAFFKHARTGKPFVIIKAGMTLDAQLATSTGKSQWITSEESRNLVHELRSRYDAVLVGVNTILADNPHLTARTEGGRDPLRVVLDSRLRTPSDSNVLMGGGAIIATTDRADQSRIQELEGKAKIWVLGREEVDIPRLMAKLGENGVTSVLIEGGGTVNAAAVKAGVVDKYILFIAPKLMLGANIPAFKGAPIRELTEAVELRYASAIRIGGDILVEAYPA